MTELNYVPLQLTSVEINEMVLRARQARSEEIARLLKAAFARLRHSLHIETTDARTA